MALVVEFFSKIFDFNTSAWQRAAYAEAETWHLVSESYELSSLQTRLELGAREDDCLNHPKFLAGNVLSEELDSVRGKHKLFGACGACEVSLNCRFEKMKLQAALHLFGDDRPKFLLLLHLEKSFLCF